MNVRLTVDLTVDLTDADRALIATANALTAALTALNGHGGVLSNGFSPFRCNFPVEDAGAFWHVECALVKVLVELTHGNETQAERLLDLWRESQAELEYLVMQPEHWVGV